MYHLASRCRRQESPFRSRAQSSWICYQRGATIAGPKGASCGTAVYRSEPVYVADILRESLWDDYRDLFLPYGIRAVWSRPLFTSEGKILGTFAILYREVRNPDAFDLQLIENASHIAGIAIERHIHEKALRYEHDRLRLLLEITTSVTSRLNLRQVVEALSTNLFSVMQCDVSALLLPDSESGELRVNILYNPGARGPFREGSFVPMNSSISGQVLRKAKSVRIVASKQEVERDHIIRALEASKWVVGGCNGAADRLGMKRTSLVYRMQKLHISRPTRS